MQNSINLNYLKNISVIQIHLAVILKSYNQIIVGNQEKVIDISQSKGTNFYNKFGLKNKIGYFTLKNLRNENYSNINYLQVY